MRPAGARGRDPGRDQRRLSDFSDNPNELVQPVAVVPREPHELPRLRNHGSLLGGSRDRDPATAPKLEQPLVAERPEGPQDRVGVHAEDGREVACRRQPLARARLAIGDRATDLCSHLLVELDRLVAVDLDTEDGARDSSVILTSAKPKP
jgi:hypothetical protein